MSEATSGKQTDETRISLRSSGLRLLASKGLKPTPRSVALSGIADKMSVYEIS